MLPTTHAHPRTISLTPDTCQGNTW